ncbi:MAG: aspartate aminotransferase family protein, partial [Verrucomicrobiota bacterium]|nr:aspartate aminotransferase family protein [Verrucomicrobiota bacterium]
YQAGTLSGNPLAMAAGLAQLRELERIDGWKLLEEMGQQLEQGTRAAMARSKRALTFHRIGSMFCLFFTGGPVVDLASAKRSDLQAFGKFFRHCLAAGVYFAPSQFETGFLSTAHGREEMERTAAVMSDALGAAFA